MFKLRKSLIYPLFLIFSSISIFIIGLINISSFYCYIYLTIILLILIIFKMYKTILKLLPITIFLSLIYFLTTFLIEHNVENSIKSIYRVLTIILSIVPSFYISLSELIRILKKRKIPPYIIIGILITFNFFPILKEEKKQIKNSMKIRNIKCYKNFYRVMIVPFVYQMINISDKLSLSLESRCFSNNIKYLGYKNIKIKIKDYIYFIIFLLILIFSISYKIYEVISCR